MSRIRQRIGDTDTTQAQIQDETVQGYLDLGYTELRTAARLCRDLAAKYARVGDINVDNQRSLTSQIYAHYIALAAEIENEERAAQTLSAGSARILVGGLDDCRGPFCGGDRL